MKQIKPMSPLNAQQPGGGRCRKADAWSVPSAVTAKRRKALTVSASVEAYKGKQLCIYVFSSCACFFLLLLPFYVERPVDSAIGRLCL